MLEDFRKVTSEGKKDSEGRKEEPFYVFGAS